jgi:hypothetical protein
VNATRSYWNSFHSAYCFGVGVLDSIWLPHAQFPYHGFGATGVFGGFPGAQYCAARANGVNLLSAPDGEVLSPNNKTLFVGNGSATVTAFDLTTTTFNTGPTVIAQFSSILPIAANAAADTSPLSGVPIWAN